MEAAYIDKTASLGAMMWFRAELPRICRLKEARNDLAHPLEDSKETLHKSDTTPIAAVTSTIV